MGDNSQIEWTDATWNPVRGCVKISPGCKHCYAETFAERFRGVVGNAYEQGFDPRTVPDKLDEPLRWKRPRRIFVNSMSDLFLDQFHDSYIEQVCATMQLASHHTYQVLTKRAERLRDFLLAHPAFAKLGHVLWGVSVEDQKYGVPRIQHLRVSGATWKMLSVEPLLEDLGTLDLMGIDWVIVGGESGPGARPMHPDWARSLRDQAVAANIPFLFKQWGAWRQLPPFRYTPAFGSGNREYNSALRGFARLHGATTLIDERMEGWDAAMLRDGCAITSGSQPLGLLGKHAAGRVLDGRTWDEQPELA